MTQSIIQELAQNALTITLMLTGPALGLSLVVGLIIGIFQAVTQINEMTLTFVPKILAVFLALALFGPWMLNAMLGYTANLFTSLPNFVR